MTLKVIDLFSGIGGFTLAADWLGGFTTVQFVEREPFCQKILHKHWPDVPIHDDVCTFNPAPRSADVVVGGFPCQDISAAGRQAGIKEGTRSGLFYELMRIVRVVGPQYVVLENVANITSNGLGIVLGELAEAGYNTEWACIPASAVGACHQRDRWWCVAYPQDSNDSRLQEAGNKQQPKGIEQHRGLGATAYPHNQRPQGLRQQLELRQGGRQEATGWRCQPRMPESDWRRFISEPVLRRGDARLSHRVDRLKALGNTVVPQVAMIPLARVLALASKEA